MVNAILLALLCVVGTIAILDLALTFAVIRRVNLIDPHGHGEQGGTDGYWKPAVGHRVGEFLAPARDGRELTRRDLAGQTALATFVMTGCGTCHDLTEEISTAAPGSAPLLVFITTVPGEDEEAHRIAASAPSSAAVCFIESRGPVAQAFGISGFPTAIRLEDGVVRAVGGSLGSVRAAAPATGSR
jgi:hypothetical protein